MVCAHREGRGACGGVLLGVPKVGFLRTPRSKKVVAAIEYIIDQVTLEKELRGEPGLFEGWNGPITAGATVVRATQDAYNFDGSVSLVRTVPTVSWLTPRNRTTVLLNGTSGQITQPAYVSSVGTPVPAQVTKTDLYHASLERDEYFLPRAYYFGIVQYDHNFSQNLQLQQIYGAGLGWTTLKTPKQTLDLTANIQYVKQTFMNAPPGDNKNLVGSTLSANYVAQLTEAMSFTQYAAFLPAFNDGQASSAVERNTLTLPRIQGSPARRSSVRSSHSPLPVTKGVWSSSG